jgi:hypothetical protein
MKVRLVRSYRSKNGNVTFVYAVSCNAQELKAYKKAQGEFYRESEDGTPLWFTTRCIGDAGTLIITQAGNIVPDMSKYDQLASIVEQYGGNLGDHLAAKAASELLGSQGSSSSSVETTVSAGTPQNL